MANMNIRKPKFFTDHINFLMASGTAQNGNFDVESGTDLITTFNLGSEAELFDMKPLNQCQFETSANSTVRADHVLVNIDLGQQAVFNCNYVAILNHNLNSCDGKIRVCNSSSAGSVDSVAEMEDGTATAVANVEEIVNADTVSSNVITPATDGSTIFSFDSSSNRYWGIQFEGSDSGNFDSTYDLKIGCIMIGESYSMPHSPDLSVTRTIVYDGVKVQQSVGGQKFGNASHLGRSFNNARNKSPFTTATEAANMYGGRIMYDMNFSYLASSDVMPSAYDSEVAASDTVISDVWNRTKGNLIPFIFSSDNADKGNDAEQSHIFARFGQSDLKMNQVAMDTFNIQMSIVEEF